MPRMTPEALALEVKKALMCDSSHRIEFNTMTVSPIQDEDGVDIPYFIDVGKENGQLHNAAKLPIELRTLEHFHIHRGSIFQTRTVVPDYLWNQMISGSNPIEQRNFYIEWAHAIVTAFLINGLTGKENHSEFCAAHYPTVVK